MQNETNKKLWSLWGDVRAYIKIPHSITSKLEPLKWSVMRRWGMLFRIFFISSLGIGGHLWLDPQPIGDVPFSQLTLNQVFSNLFDFLLIVGCFFWFVNFPKQKKKPEGPDDNPYVVWGVFGILFIFLSAIIGLVIAVLYVALS
jgi:hypothetical protein